MFKYAFDLFFKLSYIILHFISSIFMLVINGSLSTISLHRLYNDTWRFEVWHTHLKSSIKETDISYVSDKLKRKIIEDFLYANSEKLVKINITENNITQSLFSYLKYKNNL